MSRGKVLCRKLTSHRLELDDSFHDSGYTPFCVPNAAFSVNWLRQNSPIAAIINYEGNCPPGRLFRHFVGNRSNHDHKSVFFEKILTSVEQDCALMSRLPTAVSLLFIINLAVKSHDSMLTQ